MDRSLDQPRLEPFRIEETPLVDELFTITRPKRPVTTKPTAEARDPRMASTRPKGILRNPVPRMQQQLRRARGG